MYDSDRAIQDQKIFLNTYELLIGFLLTDLDGEHGPLMNECPIFYILFKIYYTYILYTTYLHVPFGRRVFDKFYLIF